MKQMSVCSGGLLRRSLGQHHLSALVLPTRQPLRHCATTPTEEEVIKAYKVLGVSTTSAFPEVKRRYVSLAKEHHPDIASSSGDGGAKGAKMVDINNAYNVVSRFHKAGRKLPIDSNAGRPHSSPGGASGGPGSSYWGTGGPRNSSQQQSYYGAQDAGYQPWHEDLDPLLYEMMWEEMRRQNEHDAFERGMHPEDFYTYAEGRPPGGSYRTKRHHPNRQGGSGGDGGKKTNNNSNSNSGGKKSGNEKAKTTTWPEADLQALVNMYQDGKSFEFIGNALGKETAKVVEEFNRWSNDNKKNRYRGNRNKNSGNRRRNPRGPAGGPFYHMEFPDGPPYGFYGFVVDDEDFDDDYGYDDDDADPYGYAVDEDYGYQDDPWEPAGGGRPTPFTGGHRMSGGPAGTPHTHRAAGNNSGGGGGKGPSGGKRRSNFFKNNRHRNFKSGNNNKK